MQEEHAIDDATHLGDMFADVETTTERLVAAGWYMSYADDGELIWEHQDSSGGHDRQELPKWVRQLIRRSKQNGVESVWTAIRDLVHGRTEK